LTNSRIVEATTLFIASPHLIAHSAKPAGSPSIAASHAHLVSRALAPSSGHLAVLWQRPPLPPSRRANRPRPAILARRRNRCSFARRAASDSVERSAPAAASVWLTASAVPAEGTALFAASQQLPATVAFSPSSPFTNSREFVPSEALPAAAQQFAGATLSVAVLGGAAAAPAVLIALIALIAIIVRRLMRRQVEAPEDEPGKNEFETTFWDFTGEVSFTQEKPDTLQNYFTSVLMDDFGQDAHESSLFLETGF
jgi:hypothetical protein